MIVLWNTIYIEAALYQLRKEGHQMKDEDAYRHCSTKTSTCWADIHFRCRMQWPKENCARCAIQRTPTHENP